MRRMMPAIAVFCALTRAGVAQQPAAECPRAEVVEVMPNATAETRAVAYRGGTIHVSTAPLATLKDIVKVGFNEPGGIVLSFVAKVGERMERITARPDFPMAFVLDSDALVSVVLTGGFGIGKQGLQVSLDNEARARNVAATLSRCVASGDAK